MQRRHTTGIGDFVGEDGLASGRPRNAHVIARDAVTCLVLAAAKPDPTAPRGEAATWPSSPPARSTRVEVDEHPGRRLAVDVKSALDRKLAALAAHRTQYALDPDLLPRPMFDRLLGTEYFVVADV